MILDYTNLAMSQTVRPKGFTLATLDFGAQPWLPIANYDQQPKTVVSRMYLVTTARHEYEGIVSQLRIGYALCSATPNESVIELTTGGEVQVYR